MGKSSLGLSSLKKHIIIINIIIITQYTSKPEPRRGKTLVFVSTICPILDLSLCHYFMAQIFLLFFI